jgi:hypothetical protein
MNAREKLDEFAGLRGWNKNKLIGWSEAADFAEWYANQSSTEIKKSECLCGNPDPAPDNTGRLRCRNCGVPVNNQNTKNTNP